jgi:hypothetical protein
LYLDAQHAAAKQSHNDVVTTLNAKWMIAVTRSLQGDHSSALRSLESLNPLVHHVAKTHPAVYYNYLNSIAIRQIALNRFDQAQQLCDVFLSSPYSPNFPMWSDTRDELRAAKDAVAATVFVNVEPELQQTAEVERRATLKSEFTASPQAELSFLIIEEIEPISESQSFFNRAETKIILKYSSAETDIDQARAISVLSKPNADLALIRNSDTPILPITSKQNRPAVQSVINSLARPLSAPSDTVPDDRRSRAPPALFKQRETKILSLVL